ncbi:LOW QUALITY PROTEIN: uncharacterized protein LOC128256208 [Drosophila gunungcola]|uniref:LOW QUALITY PROTEIN: uncharacterized protein LOC128256208 n=1 Tax=Drosophila gunungcola TaxID=103775 RepID=UPI0022DE9A0D|nr:LOW QUALITY PROTEIN: uncharacterized protein LOC128256208 [Drosophila gunungcola]
MRKVEILICLLVSGVVSSMGHLLFLKEFLKAVHNEKSISTLLLMQREVHRKDILEEIYPMSWPIMCLDETQKIELFYHFNNEILALVLMDSLKDLLLLSALAANFNHMREARIAIFMQFMPSQKFLEDIAHQAAEYKYLNLLVIEKSNKIYRLCPFPQPKFEVFVQPLEGKEIFPVFWNNFMGKIAVTMPDMVPPRSFFSIDPQTGRSRSSGYVYHLLKDFSRRRNITLALLRPLNEKSSQVDLIEMTVRGELDIPMTGQLLNFRHPNVSKVESFLGMTAISIAVPCGRELSLFDRFFAVFGLASPISFSGHTFFLVAQDVILRTISDRVRHHCRRLEFLSMVLNLRVLCCLLGMSIPLGNKVRSIRGQLTMTMSFTGLMLACIAAGQTSYLITINPQYRYIKNLQELYDSNLTVVFNRQSYEMIKQMDPEILFPFLSNYWITSSREQIEMIVALNTSYAYQTFSYRNDPFSELQRHSTRKALCRTPELDLVGGLSYSSVLQQNSIYALALRDYASQVWSAGLHDYWVKKAVRDLVSTVRNDRIIRLPFVTEFKPINLQDFKGGWYMLAVGWTLALCVFIAEVLVGWRRGRLRNIST